MSGPATDARTSARLSKQRTRDTAPEVALRRELHRRGRRFFVDRAPLTGLRRRADLVFPTLVESLLPTGLVGLVMAGLIAAVMGHTSGAINSVSGRSNA